MKEYDVIVVGSGSGMEMASEALNHGKSVAVVDRGPLGGTCLNVGCIPSKMLIYPADVMAMIKEAGKLGIMAEATADFPRIMDRMRKSIAKDRDNIRQGMKETEGLDLYEREARFIGDYTLDVGKKIRGDMILLASGARPLIPPIKGIGDADYLTNENVLELRERPENLAIIGGGYIAVEYAHFFSAMGTNVTIIQRNGRLVPEEEPEISGLLRQELSKRMAVHTGTEARSVSRTEEGYEIKARKGGRDVRIEAGRIMVAAGRQSNADLLKVQNTGVETDRRGYIKVNEHFQTTKENIWAIGDAIGKAMFKHVANREAAYAAHNAFHGDTLSVDYSKIPYAIFTSPQIASVGLTEAEARKGHDVAVGAAKYSDIAKGEAMMEECGFAKSVIERKTGRILGFHIIGPHAAMLIQEVVDIMALGGGVNHLAAGMHIHPALPELILAALQPQDRDSLREKTHCRDGGQEQTESQ